jgi:hypothetical protein
MADSDNWPLVLQDELRPADDKHCFYCGADLGSQHKRTCVMVNKKVRVRYTLEIVVNVPHSWNGGDVEFHRNNGSWCANNCANDIARHIATSEAAGNGCLCGKFKAEYLGVEDETPFVPNGS